MYGEASHETRGRPARGSAAVMSQSFPHADRPTDVPGVQFHHRFRRALPHASRPTGVQFRFHHGRSHATHSPDAPSHGCHPDYCRDPHHVQRHDPGAAPRHDPFRARRRDPGHPRGVGRRVRYFRLDHRLDYWWNEQPRCVRHSPGPTMRGLAPRDFPAAGLLWCARLPRDPILDARLSLSPSHCHLSCPVRRWAGRRWSDSRRPPPHARPNSIHRSGPPPNRRLVSVHHPHLQLHRERSRSCDPRRFSSTGPLRGFVHPMLDVRRTCSHESRYYPLVSGPSAFLSSDPCTQVQASSHYPDVATEAQRK